MKVFLAALLLITLRHSCALSPADCEETKPVAEKVLDLVNKGRRDGYLFQLLRVTDAHLDKVESADVYYLVLDVKESDCSVLSRKHWNDCEPAASKSPSHTVIGQCKVIATMRSKKSQDLRVNDFNCTTSSVSSALADTKDSPVLVDFFEDTEPYRKQANEALEKYKTENGDDFTSFRVDQVERVARVRGGERTNYYVDFSARNCSRHDFYRPSNVFGFCRAVFSYEAEASDLESPEDLVVHCDIFYPEEHRCFSGGQHHLDHPFHSGGHWHPLAGRPPFKPHGSGDHHHPHKSHESEHPSPLEDKNHPASGGPPLLPPLGSRFHQSNYTFFRHSETHRPSHNHNSSECQPHGPPPHGPPPHGPPPHGHPPHGPPPHGPPPHGPPPHGPPPHGPPPHGHPPHGPPPHGHPPHGPPPHGHPPHGHPPHGHPPHGHPPHGHPPHGHRRHGDHFHDHRPCDPPPYNKSTRDHHHPDPPPRHSKERGPGKKHFISQWRPIRYVYRLPPLNKGEFLPLPEANFPRWSLPNQNNPLKPEIQSFPQSASESCPEKFSNEFLHLLKFFEYTNRK
ncbi:histidine-rich glycoprotein [Trichechus manatus latirostris]|uniref:Histidine-rich glycoprotein n=1 Tax=Trichechus manatus latirostris TaxID=127582 RepID=A0A2Y9RB27_TRIMA|nr:histidine-rich glycoprotein [Trichechus manatus latirostris]